MARILVVDDAVENLTLIELYLRDTEFEVTTAAGGREALDLAAKGEFDLILLDVVMPGIDGFEVCRRLKDDPLTAFVPVIFLTGRLADESEKVAAYRLGAVDYIQKPVNRDELVARIRVMLELEQVRSRLDRENATLRARVGQLDRVREELGRELDGFRALWKEAVEKGAPLVLEVDGAGVVTMADPAAERLLGRAVEGGRLSDRGVIGTRIERLIEDGADAAKISVPAEDGAERVFRVVVRPSSCGGAIVILHDVTAVETAERRVVAREPAVEESETVPDGGDHRVPTYAMTDFIGTSEAALALNQKVDRLRQTRSTVLIRGETGTGKELVARALHFDGVNRHAPFIPVHCGAIAPELVESELFGHEKGAFTGAQQNRDGLFRAADGGTVFLDEIGETSPAVQVKLLRVLQRGEIRPVGANQPRIVDVRIIAATNRDLAQMVREGDFREDLYYRLQVVQVELPPLRERLHDLPLLVEHFLSLGNVRHGRKRRPVRGVSRGAIDLMLAYPWPGNVRELEHVIEGAFAMGCGELLHEEDLPESIVTGRPALGVQSDLLSGGGVPSATPEGGADADDVPDFRELRRKSERQAIVQAMRRTGGDKAAAASLLGMSRSTFYRRLRSLGIL